MLSWKLEVDFNSQNHLFYKKDLLPYTINIFICGCGHNEFIISYYNQKIEYICKNCKNDTFYDANLANDNFDFFLYNIQLNKIKKYYIYEIPKNISLTTAKCNLEVPYKIDFMKEKVYFKKKEVYSCAIKEGKIVNICHTKEDNNVFNKLQELSKTYIDSYLQRFNLTQKLTYKEKIPIAEFFIKYPYFKEFDFFFWKNPFILHKKDITIQKALLEVINNRKEKSIRKAIFKNYQNQLKSTACGETIFQWKVINLFCKEIKDPNLLSKLIGSDILLNINFSIQEQDQLELIAFLKNHYTFKQIIRLFLLSEENFMFFEDLIYTLTESKNIINQEFQKVKCTPKALHDEFVKCANIDYRRTIIDKTITYSNKIKKRCKKIKNYTIKLPHTGKDFLEWAEILQNCIAGYFDKVKNNSSLIYGFFKNKKLDFAVEINFDNKIIQANQKNNKPLSQDQQKILDLWFDENFKE